MEQTTNQTLKAAMASYRMPREDKQPSRLLTMYWNGERCVMTGGKWGSHQVQANDAATVRSHWTGYVSNNRGRSVTPAIRWSTEVAK